MRPREARDAFFYLPGLLARLASPQHLDWKMIMTPIILTVAEEASIHPFQNLLGLKYHASPKGIEVFLPHL